MVKFIKKEVEEYKVLLRSVPALITMFFCISVVGMNLMANKIIAYGNVSLFGLDLPVLAADGGLLLSWIPFICMDMVVKRFGAKAATKLNIIAMLTNLLFVGLFTLVAATSIGIGNITEIDPSFANWGEYWSQYDSFNSVFNCVWFILLSSSVAFLVSGIVNNYTNVAVAKLFKSGKHPRLEFVVRSYVSTFVGQFVDNFIFATLAFVVFAPIFWGFSPLTFGHCVVTSIIGSVLELIMEVIFSPVGYRISENWKKNKVGEEYITKYAA